MNKNRQIISELQSFFQHNDASKAINGETAHPVPVLLREECLRFGDKLIKLNKIKG